MLIRKLITSILATVLSITFILFLIFNEGEDLSDLLTTIGGTTLLTAPAILIYGVPVTFYQII